VAAFCAGNRLYVNGIRVDEVSTESDSDRVSTQRAVRDGPIRPGRHCSRF
jgi:hypothetical protein